jgi:hypothetical protein
MRAINLDGVPDPPKQKRKRKKSAKKQSRLVMPDFVGEFSGYWDPVGAGPVTVTYTDNSTSAPQAWTYAQLPDGCAGAVTYATNVAQHPPRLVENTLTPEHVAATQNDPWQIRHRARVKYPELRANVISREKFPLSDARLRALVTRVKAGHKLTDIETKFAEFVL